MVECRVGRRVAIWRNDSGANVGPVWPPLGELGNVGVFSVLLSPGSRSRWCSAGGVPR
jgi:hypothetical protein